MQSKHAEGKICTRRLQEEEDNLERRGGRGGCTAPCSMEDCPTTSTPSQNHTKARETMLVWKRNKPITTIEINNKPRDEVVSCIFKPDDQQLY